MYLYQTNLKQSKYLPINDDLKNCGTCILEYYLAMKKISLHESPKNYDKWGIKAHFKGFISTTL